MLSLFEPNPLMDSLSVTVIRLFCDSVLKSQSSGRKKHDGMIHARGDAVAKYYSSDEKNGVWLSVENRLKPGGGAKVL